MQNPVGEMGFSSLQAMRRTGKTFRRKRREIDPEFFPDMDSVINRN